MRQVKFTGSLLAWLTPRRNEPAVGGEAMYAAVAVAVGHVKFPRWRHDHLGGLVERSRGAQHAAAGLGASGVRRLATLSDDHQRLSLERVLEHDVVVAVGQVDDIVGADIEAM